MTTTAVHKVGSLMLGWLLLATALVLAPQNAEAAVVEPPASGFNREIALVSDTARASFGRSNLSAAAFLGPAEGSPCQEPHPDTGDLTPGQIEIVQVGHRDGILEQQIINVSGYNLSSPPGYRYELAVCMSLGFPPEPLAADWAGDPHELVLAEDAVSWFESARDGAMEAAFKDKVPGWRVWPDRAHPQIVGLDSWFYIENFFGLLTGRDVSGGDQVEVLVEAEPQYSQWEWSARDTNDGGTFECRINMGQGRAFTGDTSGDRCSLDWEHSSDILGEIELRVRLFYNVQITTTTLTNDDANQRASQIFLQHIYDHPGDWDVHEDADFPSDYRMSISEVLAFGFDQEGNPDVYDPGPARGATPGGKQIGPSGGCWVFGAVCKIAAEVGGAILDFVVPDLIQNAIMGCWDGASSAIGGLGDTLASLNPFTWDDKYNEFIEFKDMLQESHANGELGDVLQELGGQAAFGILHLDQLDPNNTGDFDQLVWDDPTLLAGWITAVGCEYLVGTFTGGLFAKLGTLVKILRDRKNRPDSDPATPRPDAPCIVSDSFPTGTQVRMGDGELKAIHLIEPGDTVVAYNTANEQWVEQEVLDQWSGVDDGHMTTITLADGSRSVATDHHRYWVESDGAWVHASKVAVGDQLLAPRGPVDVASVVTAPRTSTVVWELSVANDHNFTVSTGTDEVLVHNKRCRRWDNHPPSQADIDGFNGINARSRVEFDAWKARLKAEGKSDTDIQEIIHQAALQKGENPFGDDWGRYLSEITGESIPGAPMHAHHLAEKVGLGVRGKELAADNRRILEDVGIDPLLSRENLTFAPNGVPGQHGQGPQGTLNDMLKAVEGDRDGVIAVLDEWAEISAGRS